MKVILLKDVQKLGVRLDVKEVSDGYACNYLIPHGFAKPATTQELTTIEEKREYEASRKEQTEKHLRETAKNIAGTRIEIMVKTAGGKLFSAITEEMIKESLQKEGILDEYSVFFDQPIKEEGEHAVTLDFGYGITAPILVVVSQQQ